MLSGKKIMNEINFGRIFCQPMPGPEQIQPNSIDLRLGDKMTLLLPNNQHKNRLVIDTHVSGNLEIVEKQENGAFLLFPGNVYLGHTAERIGSNNYAGILHGRSSVGRHGILVHISAGFIDCGWIGQIVLEIVNLTPYPLLLYPNDRICQIQFDEVSGEIELYNSTYQNQIGTRAAKSLEDKKL